MNPLFLTYTQNCASLPFWPGSPQAFPAINMSTTRPQLCQGLCHRFSCICYLHVSYIQAADDSSGFVQAGARDWMFVPAWLWCVFHCVGCNIRTLFIFNQPIVCVRTTGFLSFLLPLSWCVPSLSHCPFLTVLLLHSCCSSFLSEAFSPHLCDWAKGAVTSLHLWSRMLTAPSFVWYFCRLINICPALFFCESLLNINDVFHQIFPCV